MRHSKADKQQGQAMLEAIFILMIFVTLLFSIQFSGRLRTHSIELLGESSYQTFLKSEQYIKRHNIGIEKISKRGLLETYFDQLLYVDDQGVVDVSRKLGTSNTDRVAGNRLFSAVPLQRTSYLYINSGHSRSGSEAHSRIAQSKAAWHDVTKPTHSVLQSYVAPLAKIDTPWQRGNLKMDWLREWADQAPGALKSGGFR